MIEELNAAKKTTEELLRQLAGVEAIMKAKKSNRYASSGAVGMAVYELSDSYRHICKAIEEIENPPTAEQPTPVDASDASIFDDAPKEPELAVA